MVVGRDTERSRHVPRDSAEARRLVASRSQDLADEALRAEALAGQLRSGKALVGQVSRDYGDRFLLELLQNSYDSIPRNSSGAVSILLDLNESPHGVLYFANSGSPFDTEDFRAVCEMAQSSKRPGQGIGNKGVGFRSVLQVSDWPEIYSAITSPSRESFEGFCFSFARPEDYVNLAGSPSKAATLQDRLSPYALPVPLGDQDAKVKRFAGLGFSTLIRLPLRSSSALERAKAQLDEIQGAPPILLFLDRIARIDVEMVGEERTHVHLSRSSSPLEIDVDATMEQVDLTPGGGYLVLSTRIDGDRFLQAIEESIEANTLDPEWRDWRDEARISIALAVSSDEPGRLYSFLPMGPEALSPLAAHVNAPFVVRLARDNLIPNAPLNEFLLDEAATLCAQSAVGLRDHVPARYVVPDLVAWTGSSIGRIKRAFERGGMSIEAAPVIPVLGPAEWGALSETYRWTDHGLHQMTSERISAATSAPILAPDAGAARADRIEELHVAVQGRSMKPLLTETADWAEAVALRLPRSTSGIRKLDPEAWLGFYDDLAALFGAAGTELAGKRIIIDDGNQVRQAWQVGGGESAPRGPAVFFHSSADEDPDEVDAPSDVSVPRSLRRHLVYTNSVLKWKVFKEDTRRLENRPGREFLQRRRLVRLPRRQELFVHVRSVLGRTQSETTFREALRFVYGLHRGPRPYNQEPSIDELGLRVPTRAGWTEADRALLGQAWVPRTQGHALETLIELGAGVSAELEGLRDRMVLPAEEWRPSVTREDWAPFLRTVGANSGLWPEALFQELQMDGHAWTPDAVARSVGLPEGDVIHWREGVAAEGSRPNHPWTKYRLVDPICRIPGQSDYEALSPAARHLFAELVIEGLEAWPDEALRFRFSRPRPTATDDQSWPSPAWTFLRSSAWLPITRPGQGSETDFASPAQAWHFREEGEAPPVFVPLLVASIRRSIDGSALLASRLSALGVKIWNDPATAADRVAVLGDRFQYGIAGSQLASFRKAYERAWSDLVRRGQPVPWSDAADLPPLIVSRRGQLTSVSRGDEERPEPEPLYVLGGEDRMAEVLLGSLDVPVLRVDPRDGPAVAGLLRELHMGEVRIVRSEDFHVFLDEERVEDGDGALLLVDEERGWLAELLALTLELKATQFNRQTEKTVNDAIERLRRIAVIAGGRLRVELDEKEVALPASLRGVLPIPRKSAPTLAFEGDSGALDWPTLQRLAQGTAELVGQSLSAPALELAMVSLRSRGGGSAELFQPTDEDYAAVFGESVDRVREILRGHHAVLDELVYLLRPVLQHLMGSEVARLFAEHGRDATSEQTLESFLHAYEAEFPSGITVRRLLDLCRSAKDLAAMRDALDIDYGDFNRCLRELGPPYRPLHNREGHATAFAAFLVARRDAVLNSLRNGFLPTFDSGENLNGYVTAKEEFRRACLMLTNTTDKNPPLMPDEAWLDEVESPSDEQMAERLQAWESRSFPTPHGHDEEELPPLDVVRRDNEEEFESAARRAERIVPAWCAKHGVPCPPLWEGDNPAGSLVRSFVDQGLADFRRLLESDVLDWMRTQGAWPEGMPLETDPTTLELSADDLLARADREAQERRERELARRTVEFNGRRFSLEQDSIRELADAVQSGVSDALLRTAPKPLHLEPIGQKGGRKRTGGGGGGGGGFGRISEEQRQILGFMGELVAFEWLKHQYNATPEAWRSRNRRFLFSDHEGDDGLGYDFEIVRPRGRLFFEVKAATSGSRFAIELSETELLAAQENARNSRYRIIFVSSVRDPDLRRLHVLPNPMSPSAHGLYRVVGTGIRYEFALGGVDEGQALVESSDLGGST
jgi:hypothetical protein